MGWFTRYSIKICLLAYLLTIYCSEDIPSGPKRKGATNSKITPFIRIGRGGYQLTENTMEDEEPEMFAPVNWLPSGFPVQKKSGSDADLNKGLWFGPRLGRLEKRHYSKRNLPWNYVLLGDYTQRLGNKEEEDENLPYNAWNA